MGLSEKSDFLEGFTKNQYRGGGELPKKGDLDSFAGLKEGLGKKEGGLRGRCTLWKQLSHLVRCSLMKKYFYIMVLSRIIDG